MIIIVSRTKKDQVKFDWLKFSSRFINGGLPLGNQNSKILNAHLYRGFNARTAQDEPKHRHPNNGLINTLIVGCALFEI